MMNYQDFQTAIQELESFYGGKILNGGILEATWYECFKNVSIEDLNYAISKCFRYHPRQYNYFPNPEEIRKLLFDSQENHQASKVVNASDFILPPEDDDKACKRNMIWRLYQHYKIRKKVGISNEDREDFFKRFSNHSFDELELLIGQEVHQIAKKSKADPLINDAITPEAREYLEKFSDLIRGKKL
jgi:hypothetical protein